MAVLKTHRAADDAILIQAARPVRTNAATPGAGDGGVMLGKLASLRMSSATASPATEPGPGDATVLPEPGEQRSLLLGDIIAQPRSLTQHVSIPAFQECVMCIANYHYTQLR